MRIKIGIKEMEILLFILSGRPDATIQLDFTGILQCPASFVIRWLQQ